MPVCTSAVRVPSVRAPRATRWTDGVRPPTVRYTLSRESIMRTGRPVTRAAMTASTVPGQICHFPPKAPPTYGEITRTPSRGTANFMARCVRTQSMFCVPSWTVSRSRSQAAVAECGSRAL